MNREYLESLGLEKDVINSIMAEHGKTVNDAKSKLVTAEQENEALKEQIATRDSDIEKLKADSGSSAELKTQLEELTGKYEADTTELNAKLSSTKLNYEVERELTKNKAKNATAVKALLDLDTIKLTDDGGVQGLTEQLEKVKAENEYLFGSEEPAKPAKVVVPGNPNGGTRSDTVTTEQFDAMTHAEKIELHTNQPETFKALTGQ